MLWLLSVLTATVFMVVPTRSADDPNWDPWADIKEDGTVDIYDAITLANAYGSSGDTPRNVNVVNWPVTNQQTVFYIRNASENSVWFNASGFGHLHFTWNVNNLAGIENVTFYIWARIDSPDGTSYQPFIIESLIVTFTNSYGAMSFPVPSEQFQFRMVFGVGTTASASLAFYLTYA